MPQRLPLRALLRLAMISTEEGARTSLYCALSPAVAGETGLYYSDCRPVAPSAVGLDRVLAGELWRRSAAWIARGGTRTSQRADIL